MRVLWSVTSTLACVAFVLQTTGLAYAQPPQVHAPPGPPPEPSLSPAPTPPFPGGVFPPGQPALYLPYPQPPSVVVHLDAEQGVTLQGLPSGAKRWAPVCAAPCDFLVPLEGEYRITGRGLRSTKPFVLVGETGQRINLEVEPSSQGGFVGGIVLGSVGVVSVITGTVLWLLGAACSGGACSVGDTSDNGTYSTMETAGVVLSVTGAAALVGGIVLLVSNIHSTSRQTLAEWLPHMPRSSEVGWHGMPRRDEGSVDSPMVLPKVMSLPFLSHRF
jgi:hypothetical protein